MSHWTVIVFDPGNRDPDAVEADLLESIRTGDDSLCRNPDDPRTWQESDGRVGWYLHGFSYEETIAQLTVPCRRALAMDVNDTSEAAVGYLYEWVDGAFLKVDTYADNEYGRACLDYFALKYGIQGERRV
ncbi:hypothetical protein [Natrinema salaciae]|uniref:Uncharacterized protein n=1 Tax=Natrinema salaciae TaxID=1186196 RepID=A0A1H9S9Y1_9EURY|nr:hypothetical protein [Natrinema salaciae]SER81405.1 hypothetical protein SAMN04489841_4631 [Natrinema salaciae]